MKLAITIALAVLLSGCLFACAPLDMKDMTAAQLKATNGFASCGTATNIYGKVAIITANTDDASRGTNQKGRMAITCGDAMMTIDNNVSVPVQPMPVTVK